MIVPAALNGDTTHLATRPDWNCLSCGERWPCPSYMAYGADAPMTGALLYFAQLAIRDLIRERPVDIVRRFLFESAFSPEEAYRLAHFLMTSNAPFDEPKTRHRAMRPLWDCAECRDPWPCVQARADLLAEYAHDPRSLLAFLGGCLAWAGDQMRQLHLRPDPDVLAERFVNWAWEALPVAQRR
jgi:hypothetical protein